MDLEDVLESTDLQMQHQITFTDKQFLDAIVTPRMTSPMPSICTCKVGTVIELIQYSL